MTHDSVGPLLLGAVVAAFLGAGVFRDAPVGWLCLGGAVFLIFLTLAWYLLLAPAVRRKNWQRAARQLGFSFHQAEAGLFMMGGMTGEVDGLQVCLQHRPPETGSLGSVGGTCELSVTWPSPLGLQLDLRGERTPPRQFVRWVLLLLALVGLVPLLLAACAVIPLAQAIFASLMYLLVGGGIALAHRAERRARNDPPDGELDTRLAPHFVVADSRPAWDWLAQEEVIDTFVVLAGVGRVRGTDTELRLASAKIPSTARAVCELVRTLVDGAGRLLRSPRLPDSSAAPPA